MGNEFDLERAKAGEPIERLWHGEWIKANFIGMSLTHGDPIVEIWREVAGAWDCPSRSPRDVLRMAPKKVKVRYRNYMLSDIASSSVGVLVDRFDGDTPEDLEKRTWFRGWIHTDWQEAEVTE